MLFHFYVSDLIHPILYFYMQPQLYSSLASFLSPIFGSPLTLSPISYSLSSLLFPSFCLILTYSFPLFLSLLLFLSPLLSDSGWSTSVPTYNPREIISNLRLMIAGENPTEMHPWYRGFKGK